MLVGGGALALRLPYLQTIPAYSDEVVDIYRALLAAQGRSFPLTDTSSYIGSLWTWLQAAAFKLSGFQLAAPRALVMLLGVAAVLATYGLARAWGGRLAGLLAGGLLATSGSHVVVSSHIAYSNSITPLFTTLGVWAVWRATGGETEGGRRKTEGGAGLTQDSGLRTQDSGLLLAGALWGLALQTHPSVLALLPGTAVFLIWKRRDLLRSRWLWLAAALFVAVNLNLIVYNLISGFDSVAYGMRISGGRHTRNQPELSVAYGPRLGRFGLGVVEALGGAIDDRDRSSDYFQDPPLLAIVGASALGVAWQLRRRNPLPGLILASMWLVMPVFTHRFDPLLDTRYIMPLFPLLYAATGALIADAVTGLQARSSGRPIGRTLPARCGQLGLLAAALFLVVHPTVYLPVFYRQATKAGQTNDQFFQSLAQLQAARRPDEPVLIDERLGDVVFGLGVGKANNGFRLALSTADVPNAIVDLAAAERLCRSQLVVYANGRPGAEDPLMARLDLRTLEGAPARTASPGPPYGLYRLEPRPGASGCG